MTTEAGSGHPTSCLSAADLIAAVFFRALRYDVRHIHHPTNDRFILSKGHAAPLLYAVWAEAGAIPAERLMTLRRVESELEGHPTPRFPWAEVATGSLGQGLSIGVGMALAGKYLDRLDYRVYVLLGDGETAEGAVWEAVALAAYYRLNNLIALVDVNRLGQSQATMYGHDLDSYERRFRAFGWHAISIDGHDLEQIVRALDDARRSEERPVAIIARTVKGKGVSFLEDKEGWHGKPLRRGEETERALRDLGVPEHWPIGEIEPPAGLQLLSPPPPSRWSERGPIPDTERPLAAPHLSPRRSGGDARGLRNGTRTRGPDESPDRRPRWGHEEFHVLGEIPAGLSSPVLREVHRRAEHGGRGHRAGRARLYPLRLHLRLLPHPRVRSHSNGRHLAREHQTLWLARRSLHR
jgi:transketolase